MKLFRCLAAVLSALPAIVFAAGHDWMATQPGGLRLSQLSIPGTHDSGALYEPLSGTAKCQNLTIAQQLAAGVRFLDIRCRHTNNAFSIHHGSVYQNADFDDVLNAVIDFLAANPTETVIMSVKEEHTAENNTRSFEQTFDFYVAKNPARWLLGAAIPKLSEARGKIVLLRRFGAGGLPKGISATSWEDNTTFTTGNLRVQDQYVVPNNDDKWARITAMFTEANTEPANRMFLNFTSGYRSGTFGIPSITTVSSTIDPRLRTWLGANKGRRYGVVVMDFVTAELCSLIIDGAGLYHDNAFMVVNRNSGKTLDLIGGNKAEGARINQWQYDYHGQNQRWALIPGDTNGRFLLVSLVGGRCATMISTANGAALTANAYVPSSLAQQWEFVDAGNGWVTVRNAASGKVLDVAGGSLANDATIQQMPANGAMNQSFRLQPWGDYFIEASGGKTICVQGGGSTNGRPIIQFAKENNFWFKWRFESAGEGHLKVASLNALYRVLCVMGGSTANGADCHLFDYDSANTGDQKVRIVPRSSGRFKFQFVHSGKMWDIPGGNAANNISLEQYTDNANAWQEFELQRDRVGPTPTPTPVPTPEPTPGSRNSPTEFSDTVRIRWTGRKVNVRGTFRDRDGLRKAVAFVNGRRTKLPLPAGARGSWRSWLIAR